MWVAEQRLIFKGLNLHKLVLQLFYRADSYSISRRDIFIPVSRYIFSLSSSWYVNEAPTYNKSPAFNRAISGWIFSAK